MIGVIKKHVITIVNRKKHDLEIFILTNINYSTVTNFYICLSNYSLHVSKEGIYGSKENFNRFLKDFKHSVTSTLLEGV